MNGRRILLSLFTVFLLIAASQIHGIYSNTMKDLPHPQDIDGSTLVSIPPVEIAIATLQERVRENPADAVSNTLLGEQYMRQARETGDVSGYNRAEAAFQHSLELVSGYAPAQTGLASVYYSRHEFSRALELAQAVYEVNYRNEQARLIVADSHLSMGNYDQAEEIYEELAGSGSTAPYLARLANLADLKGDPEAALALMRRAAGFALRSGGTRETTAWYLLRVGDLYFNRGETEMAGDFYEASLRVFDSYPPALAGLGKVSAAEREYEEAITYYQQAVEVVPQPEFHAALGDLYTLLERPDLAAAQYDTVAYIGKLAALNEQVYNRQLANFYSDHDMHVQEALQLALAELEVRRDIYGYDAAAWAYYKNGKFTEAQSMIDRALSLGTRDAGLYYHAGMIAQALHREEEARRYLEEALAINPYFSVLSAGEARAMLQSLRQAAAR